MVSKELLRKLRKRKRHKEKGLELEELEKELKKEIGQEKAEKIRKLIEKEEQLTARINKLPKGEKKKKVELLEKRNKVRGKLSTGALQLGRGRLGNKVLKEGEKAMLNPEENEKEKN